MTDFPTSVKIGYRDFKVVDWDRQDADSAACFGDCNVKTGVIRVCRDFGEQKSANTLVHEVLHGCWSVAALADKVSEEAAVTNLSNVFSQVIRDNPALVAYLQAALAP